MRRVSIVALFLAGALLTGCTPAPPVATQAPDTSQPPSSTSATTGTAQPTTSAPPVASPVVVRVYLAYNEKMQPVLRQLPAGTKTTLKSALVELLKGPNAAETAAGMSTQIPAGTTLRSVKVSGKIATVDLSAKFGTDGGMSGVTNRLAQVVFTATQFSTVSSVRFKVNGKTVSVFTGEGIMLNHPQKRSDYEYSTAPIFVDNPAWQATIKKGMTARGTANVFEATFHVQVRDAAGTLLVNKTVHATRGTGTRGSWSLKLTWAAAAPGMGQLRVFAASPKNGAEIDGIDVPVVISD